MDPTVTIRGEVVRALIRKDPNLTQARVAEHLEVSESMLSKMLSGDRRTSWAKANELAQILGEPLRTVADVDLAKCPHCGGALAPAA